MVLDAASPVGPVVALGVPAENAAPLGARASIRTMLNGKTLFVVSFNGAGRSMIASKKATGSCGS